MAEKGRAAVYLGRGKPFEIREYPVPDPEPGAIVLKVRRANLCGSDMHMWRAENDLEAMGAPLPAILGHEMMGTVYKLGPGVVTDSAGQPLAEGDRVVHRYFYPCGRCRACVRGDDAACPIAPLAVVSPAEEWPHFTGTYAEYYYLRPNHTVFKVPDELSDDMAAPANCALSTVLYGLEKVKFSFGENIVIQGAGGLGIYATALAKEMGAAKVIVVDGIDERLQLARQFGADELIDLREYKTPTERWLRVRELTGGWGADVVAELVGSAQVIPEGLDMLGNGGRYLEIGCAVVFSNLQLDVATLVMNNKSIFGVILYSPEALRKALEFLVRAKSKYPFDKILSHSYPLDKINEAFEEQNKGHVCRSTLIP